MKYTQEQIEREFKELEDRHNGGKKKGATGCQDVLQFLLDRYEAKNKIWYWSWEFISRVNSKGSFLSHRAPARASDLALHHPRLVEDRRIGRFKVYRMRAENMSEIIEYLHGVSTENVDNSIDTKSA